MVVSNEQLRKIVVDGGHVAREAWDAAVANAGRRDRDTLDVLVERGLIDGETLHRLIAEYLNVPYVDLRKEKIDFEVLKLLPEPTLQELKAVPFGWADDQTTINVAFLRPQETLAIDEIQKLTDLKVKPYLTGKKSFAFAMRLWQRDLGIELDKLIDETTAKAKRSRKGAPPDYPIVRIMDTILTHAVMNNASDVHIEPLSDAVLVRFRVDGILRDMLELPKILLAPLVTRVKVLSNLKLDEHRLPQDGRLAFFAEDENIFVRVSVLPTFLGEKIVMRILNEGERRQTLTDLGLEGRALELVDAKMKRPRGMMLVVGPTGSGKTTTLYALLTALNTEKINISTIEDPIEYSLPRVNQTQVNDAIGYGFSNGLRALLRQDPNIIMVGEIRDEDTSSIAVQAGLTGHLVLSTLHTNDAVGVVPRLLEMGVKPFVLTSTVGLVIAQRLVRKICPDCSEPYRLSVEETANLDRDFRVEDVLRDLRRLGLIEKRVSSPREIVFHRGRGCNQCRQAGYVGRVGVFEVMEMGRAVKDAIVSGASADAILDVARQNGMLTLTEACWAKVLKGVTTMEELLRVVKE